MKAPNWLKTATLNLAKWLGYDPSNSAEMRWLKEQYSTLRKEYDILLKVIDELVAVRADEDVSRILKKPPRQPCQKDCEFCERGLPHSGDLPPGFRTETYDP